MFGATQKAPRHETVGSWVLAGSERSDIAAKNAVVQKPAVFGRNFFNPVYEHQKQLA